jgi:hypothetical protein
MFRFKQSLITIAGLIGLVSLIALITPLSGRGQSGNQHPLSVSVVNTAADPALVRDVGVPLRTPVQIKVNTGIPFGALIGDQNVFTVPAGKRLVIEHVALDAHNLNPGNAARGSVVTNFEGQSFTHHFDVRAQAPVQGPLFIVNHSLLAFADPGTVVTLMAVIDQAQGEGQPGFQLILSGTLSGYLETVP